MQPASKRTSLGKYLSCLHPVNKRLMHDCMRNFGNNCISCIIYNIINYVRVLGNMLFITVFIAITHLKNRLYIHCKFYTASKIPLGYISCKQKIERDGEISWHVKVLSLLLSLSISLCVYVFVCVFLCVVCVFSPFIMAPENYVLLIKISCVSSH